MSNSFVISGFFFLEFREVAHVIQQIARMAAVEGEAPRLVDLLDEALEDIRLKRDVFAFADELECFLKFLQREGADVDLVVKPEAESASMHLRFFHFSIRSPVILMGRQSFSAASAVVKASRK